MSSLPAPWSLILPAVCYMMLPALVTAAAVMALVAWLGGAKQAHAGAAAGLMAGVLAGLCVRDTAPLFSGGSWDDILTSATNVLALVPGESWWNRLPWAVLAALCIGRVAYLVDVHSGDGWLLRAGVAVATAWSVIPQEVRDKYLWLAPAFAVVVWALWVILDRVAAEPGSGSVAVCMTLSLLAAGGVLIHAGSAKAMDVVVVLAFALIGVWIIASLRDVEFGGAVPGVAVALPGVLLMGHQDASEEVLELIHWSAFALPACAPIALAVTLPITHWRKPWLHLLRVALILIPLGIAIALAMEAGPLDLTGGAGED
jgi:hypothetical protein